MEEEMLISLDDFFQILIGDFPLARKVLLGNPLPQRLRFRL